MMAIIDLDIGYPITSMSWEFNVPIVRLGWQCPNCGTIYSPDRYFCNCGTRKELIDTTLIDITGDIIEIGPTDNQENKEDI